MTDVRVPPSRRRKGLFAAALLATTVIAGGGFAWAEAGSTDAATTPATPGATAPATAPLGLAPVVNQAGFADLAAKVAPAVVNIATTEGADPGIRTGAAEFSGPNAEFPARLAVW